MHKAASYLLATLAAIQTISNPIFAETDSQQLHSSSVSTEHPASPSSEPSKSQKPFTAFTGRTLRNKVRIRLQPSLDAPILREINKGDLFIVVGETEDFYAVEAPSDVKGYVFRTFVLDDTVEGSRVNVRLEPNLDAPVIAQLQSGDKVHGQVSPLNSKWLEIDPPQATRFYIAKDYVEKIGDANLKLALDHKREEGTQLLNTTFAASQTELRKPWNQINLEIINENLNKVIKNYPEFPEIQGKAKELLGMIQESYFQKKMEYLEALSKNTDLINAHNKELSDKLVAQEQRIQELQESVTTEENQTSSPSSTINPIDKMNSWLPVENQLYETWAEIHENQPISAFYELETQNAKTIKGVLQPYDRSVRNKPGDFVLLNPATRIPVAYLYSTQVNLYNYAGKEVTLKVSPRDNNHFAYPAYFVLSVE